MAFGSGAKFRLARVLASIALIAAFMVANVLPTFAAGGTSGNIQGSAIDSNGNGIAGATISVASPSLSTKATSDASGFFSIVNVPVDSYIISISATGYDTVVIRGVTVQGDQTVTLNKTALTKSLQTIGRVQTRTASSAVQPGATTDQFTISGDRALQANGRLFNTNTAQLALSAPGVTLTGGGNISIRGSRSSDVGYQFEGVDFREPQANGNAAGTFAGLNSMQVVGGAGDASQGNVGSGVINLTVKRGTYPATGTLEGEVIPTKPQQGTYQYAFEYGAATRDGHFSNYISYINQRAQDPQIPITTVLGGSTFTGCGIDPTNILPASVGCEYASSHRSNSDFLDNFIFRFGKDQDQSLQVLYRNRYQLTFGNLGGMTGLNGAPTNYYYNTPGTAFFNGQNLYSGLKSTPGACGPTFANSVTAFNCQPNGSPYTASQLYSAEIPLLYGTPPGGGSPGGPIESTSSNLNFLDLAYTKNFGSSSSLTVRSYNWQEQNVTDRSYGFAAPFAGSLTSPLNSTTGGQVQGIQFDFLTQLGQSNTISVSGKFENTHPLRDAPQITFGSFVFNGAASPAGSTLSPNQFLSPANTTLPISASNPCPVKTSVDPTACYVYNYQYTPGAPAGASFNGGPVGRLVNSGVGYGGSEADYQFWGIGLRDQIALGTKVKLDIGGRFDGANYKQTNAFCFFADCMNNNSQDVDPATVQRQFTNPSVFEPRAALSYQFTKNDSARFAFGRSVNLIPGQGFGTPFQLYGLQPQLNFIPALDTSAAPECGNNLNPARYTPTNPQGLIQCQTYAQQLYWASDQIDAPDVGGTLPPIYNNYELSFQHQFANGMGLRATGFFKRGYNIATLILLRSSGVDPTSGAPTSIIYGGGSNGIEKTTGGELYFTLPDRREGWSGFLSATYLNSFSNIPAGSSGEEGVNPLYSPASAANNLLYHVGYLSPVTARAGITYRHQGWRINPILAFDNGFPISVGNNTAFGANAATAGFLNGTPLVVKATNLGLASPCVYVSSCGSAAATALAPNYVDPAFPGSYLNPNIAATRGTSEGGNAGSILSKARLGVDLDIEYMLNARSTVGLYIGNLFNNPYGLSAGGNGIEPFPNNRYQAVGNGVAGPMTGTVATGIPGPTGVQNNYNGGAFNYPSFDCGQCAYIEPTAGAGRTLRFYYLLKL
jgi:hypothetical protein